VTILILLVLVVLLWVAVLAPSAWRRFGERHGVGSIDHFHHQLQLLEHAGPKTVSPAYRLHTAVPGDGPVVAPAPGPDTSRPKLVLLRPTDDAASSDVDDDAGTHYELVGVLDRPEPACLPEYGADLPAIRRDHARRRCTVLLRCLWGVAVSTGLIGIFPGMQMAWVFTGLFGLAALGLVGLMAYAKELQAEQQRRRARRVWRQDAGESTRDPAGPAAIGTAGSSYPGTWDDDEIFDDDFEVPRAAAR
jgi:hypothetical protein